jgi:hypothetical protein
VGFSGLQKCVTRGSTKKLLRAAAIGGFAAEQSAYCDKAIDSFPIVCPPLPITGKLNPDRPENESFQNCDIASALLNRS